MDSNDSNLYLEEVKEALNKINSETGDSVERRKSAELLVSNVLKEYSEQPLPALTDTNSSRIFDLLFAEASFDSLVSFLSKLTDQLLPLCSNPFGSHACEHLLISLFQKAHNRRERHTFDEVLSHLCDQMCDEISEFLDDKFATHVVRYLIGALSGVDVSSMIKAPVHKQFGVTNIQLNSAPKIQSLSSSRYEQFRRVSTAIVGLLEYDCDQTKYFVSSPVSSPTLQALLIALSVLKDEKFVPFVCLILDSKEDDLEFEEAHVKRLMQGKVSSHFMEVLFRVIPKDLLNKVFGRCLLPNLLQLSLHPSANFPLQTALSQNMDVEMLKTSIAELGPHFNEILTKKRTGVVVTLFTRSLESGIEQAALCQNLQDALKKMKTSSQTKNWLCEILLCHGMPTQLGVDFQKLSHKGCILLETLLHYPQDCIHAFLVSLKSIDEKGIEHIANDNCGARVLEQFFNNEEIPKPMKKTVLSKLKNRWTQLAMSSSGSHLLEACFNFAKPELRSQIMQNLELNKPQICQTAWGSAAFRRCQEVLSSGLKSLPKKTQRQEVDQEEQKSKRRKKKKSKLQKAVFCAPNYG